MTERVFLDTNILIYADDADAGEKRTIAQSILRRVLTERSGVLSTQVLQEFFVVATRKLRVDSETARRKVELLSSLDVVAIDVAEILATSVAQVRALVQSGELRYIQIGGRQQYRIETVELEKYIQRMYAESDAKKDRQPTSRD